MTGCHVIKLGPGCDEAAEEALKAWENGLQIGGGINDRNAKHWIDMGAEKVIITSYLFPDGKFSRENLEKVVKEVGKERLVIDLSCRRRENGWWVAMDRWQRITETEVNKGAFRLELLWLRGM